MVRGNVEVRKVKHGFYCVFEAGRMVAEPAPYEETAINIAEVVAVAALRALDIACAKELVAAAMDEGTAPRSDWLAFRAAALGGYVPAKLVRERDRQRRLPN